MGDGVIPPSDWASEVLKRLDALPTILRQQETIGRLLSVIQSLKDKRNRLSKALIESRSELATARAEVDELQQVIIKRLSGKP